MPKRSNNLRRRPRAARRSRREVRPIALRNPLMRTNINPWRRLNILAEIRTTDDVPATITLANITTLMLVQLGIKIDIKNSDFFYRVNSFRLQQMAANKGSGTATISTYSLLSSSRSVAYKTYTNVINPIMPSSLYVSWPSAHRQVMFSSKTLDSSSKIPVVRIYQRSTEQTAFSWLVSFNVLYRFDNEDYNPIPALLNDFSHMQISSPQYEVSSSDDDMDFQDSLAFP